MWWTELRKPESLLSETLTVCVVSMKHLMPLVVTPSFNIQFITFCIMYTLPSLPPPPETPIPTPPHLRISTALMKLLRCHAMFALKPNVSCTERHTGSSRQWSPLAPPPLPNIQQQSESRMNKHGELRYQLRLSVMWRTSAQCLYPVLTAKHTYVCYIVLC